LLKRAKLFKNLFIGNQKNSKLFGMLLLDGNKDGWTFFMGQRRKSTIDYEQEKQNMKWGKKNTRGRNYSLFLNAFFFTIQPFFESF
jgi:hypothetical protein